MMGLVRVENLHDSMVAPPPPFSPKEGNQDLIDHITIGGGDFYRLKIYWKNRSIPSKILKLCKNWHHVVRISMVYVHLFLTIRRSQRTNPRALPMVDLKGSPNHLMVTPLNLKWRERMPKLVQILTKFTQKLENASVKVPPMGHLPCNAEKKPKDDGSCYLHS